MAEQPHPTPLTPQEPVAAQEDLEHGNNQHEQETGTVSAAGYETPNEAPTQSFPKPRVSFQEPTEELPPAKPPRPINAHQQAEHTLIEAFPSIDTKVVKAVLMASNGKVEPAFNALLAMSDPDFNPDEHRAVAPPPPQPPRPAQRAPQTQLEADEIYARKLAEQYNMESSERGQARYNHREEGRRAPNQQPARYDEQDREHSFFDDDLPEIGRNIQQGFMETQKKVNSWISNFRKKIDGEDGEEDLYGGSQPSSRQNTGQWDGRGDGRQNFGSGQSEQQHGIRKSAETNARRSTEAQRYDADPHELGDEEFERLELRDDDAPPPPQPLRTSSRKTANPELFTSTTARAPQSGPVDEVEAAERRKAGQEDKAGKKWQPLTAVAPHPEDENDPFSVGDDEEDQKEKAEDVRKQDTERLKKAASTSGTAGTAGDEARVLEETERSGNLGTKNKEAEALLSGKKK